MSPAPGTQILSLEKPPARSAPTDTGVWFVAGITERGPSAPVLVRSLSEYIATFGQRVTYGLLYDALDTYFREGGNQAYVSRVTGPNPVIASGVLRDGAATPAVSLTATAENAGVWGNNLAVQVLAGVASGTFQISVQSPLGTEIERSGDLPDQASAIAWAQNSVNINLALGVSALPPVPAAAVALTGGTGDHINAVDQQWRDALGRFPKSLGCGQVSMPGRTTGTANADLLAHAAANNRVAVLDAPDTPSVASLRTAALALRTTLNARCGALFAPWDVVPGILPGTTRTVPPSAEVAGLIARSDAGNSPNVPAAGENGQADYALGLSQPAWSDTDRASLNDAGVNVQLVKYDGVRLYGYRSLVDPVLAPAWIDFSNGRLNMAISAEADAIAERYVFSQLDGQGINIGKFGGELTGMLLGYYTEGSLYGTTPDEAFRVDVGAQVNTPARIAAGELHAVLNLKFSPFAERVVVEIVKTAITEAVA